MDSKHFDELTRALSTKSDSRRAALRRLLGTATALLGGLTAFDAAAAAGCRTNSQCGRCRRCQKQPGQRQGRCVPARNGQACGECRRCRNGRCAPAPNGQACRQCGQCQSGACRPVAGRCGGTDARCTYCRQDGICTVPRPCGPCEVCDQAEGCVRDDVLVCGENRECCLGDCCDEGESCKGFVCCTPDRFCGERCCRFGTYCASAPRSQCCPDGAGLCGTECCDTASGCYECVSGQCRYKCVGFDFCDRNGICQNCGPTGCGG
jgi:hypothetical protein